MIADGATIMPLLITLGRCESPAPSVSMCLRVQRVLFWRTPVGLLIDLHLLTRRFACDVKENPFDDGAPGGGS